MSDIQCGRVFGILLAILCVSVLMIAGMAHAELRIDVTRGVVEPRPIVILPFQDDNAQASKVGADVAAVMSADLSGSGLFRPLDSQSININSPRMDTPPRFSEWRQLNAEALVHGRTTLLPDGRLKIEFRLWDVVAGTEMLGRAYSTQPDNWRRIAHVISDAIYKRITGEDGYFDTRIVYIAEFGPHTRRLKQLAIMDQDGANIEMLTDGSSLVLTPRFSPSLQEITFLRYVDQSAKVFIRQLQTGHEELVGGFQGMTFAPRFSPDGERLIMSLAQHGNTDIYTFDMRTRAVRQLTTNSAIDTSPSYAPDGKRIVFNSDRGGGQHLYIMEADGTNVRRISRGDGRYSTPVWSPRGDLIAFTKINNGQFYIGVMQPDGSGERALATGYHVGGPSWAPNGRVIVFYKQERIIGPTSGGRSRLFTVDLTGRNEREIPTPHDASDPAWSPLRP